MYTLTHMQKKTKKRGQKETGAVWSIYPNMGTHNLSNNALLGLKSMCVHFFGSYPPPSPGRVREGYAVLI